jgi:hypothetical protein
VGVECDDKFDGKSDDGIWMPAGGRNYT